MRWTKTGGILIFLGAIVFVAFALYFYQQRQEAIPAGFVFASGRIEGDTLTVATKIAGRVEKIYFKEGQDAVAGQVLAQISSQELQARLEAAKAGAKELKAHYLALKVMLANAEEVLAQRERDLKRMQYLFGQHLIARSRLEQAQLAFSGAKAQVDALRERLKAGKEAFARARAQVAEVEALLNDTLIRAPAKGVIIRRVANLGEVLSPGGVIALMVDLDKLYLKAYVPEKEIGRLALGQQARIYIDAFPQKAFKGRVGYIAKKAEFTPKEVQTKDARVKQVYAIKIFLEENPGHILTPGLPADALIKIDPKAPWPTKNIY